MSLRRAVPTRLRSRDMTPFPYEQTNASSIKVGDYSTAIHLSIAANRADYVLTRHGYAIWKTSPVPGWFFRVANTILPERDRQNLLRRLQPSGPDDSTDQRGERSERSPVRDGPAGEVTGDAGNKFRIWEG